MSAREMPTRHAAFDEWMAMISAEWAQGQDPDLFAFFSRHPAQADSLKVGVIRLLQADDDAFIGPNSEGKRYTEDDSEHWAAAIQLVSNLKDERSIPALVDALSTGGMASAGVVQFGKKALGAVLSRIDGPNPRLRHSAVGAAITILRQETDSASRDQILDLIGAALRDREFSVRYAALAQIDNLSSDKRFSAGLRALLPVLNEMAQSDPFILPSESRYPLRASAKALLDKLKGRL